MSESFEKAMLDTLKSEFEEIEWTWVNVHGPYKGDFYGPDNDDLYAVDAGFKIQNKPTSVALNDLKGFKPDPIPEVLTAYAEKLNNIAQEQINRCG